MTAKVSAYPTWYRTTMDWILIETAKEFGVTKDDIIANQRTRNQTLPRHVAMYIAYKMTDYGCPTIARKFRRSDHTSVRYAIQKIELRLLSESKAGDTEFNEKIEQIIARVREREEKPA